MKRKSSLHSVLSETQILASKGRAIDDRETDAVGRRSFLRRQALRYLLGIGARCAGYILSDGGRNNCQVQGGIGVMPASTVGSANVVQGVQPPGEPWVIHALSAEVKQDGRIHVEGRGLLLAGGNGIGTNGGQKVFATLICGTALFSTPVANAVALAADGDFTIDDVLSPVPPLDCANPILLIRTAAGNNPWFAAGIPVVFQ